MMRFIPMMGRRRGSAAAGVAPAFSAAPVVLGTPTVGTPVSYLPGTVTGTPTPTVTRQWLRDGAAISGATGSTYTPVAGDVGSARLSVRETATNASGSANSTSSAVNVAAAGSVTQAQDWANRSTAAGVLRSVVWEDATTYFGNPAYVHPDIKAGNVAWFPDDGILGNGCLNIKIATTDGANSGAWRCPLDPAWVTDNQSLGTQDLYIQMRVKFGPNRFVEEPPGTDGPKVLIIGGYRPQNPSSSRSHVNNELVVQFYGQQHTLEGTNTITAYRDLSQGTLGSSAEWFAGTSNSYQNMVDNGSGISDPLLRFCRYDPSKPDQLSDGCVRLREHVWYTLYVHAKVVTPGGTAGNVFEMSIAGPDDSSYTPLISLTNVLMPNNSNDPADGTTNGVNGLWLLPYKTNRGANPNGWDSYQRYDQLIISTQPIACPAPRALPSFVPATLNDWASIAGTAMSAVQPANTGNFWGTQGPPGVITQWAGMATDVRNSSMYSAGQGGHNAYGGNEVYKISMEAATPAFTVLRGPTQTVSDSGYYPDGRPTSVHGYYSHQFNSRFAGGAIDRLGGSRWVTGDTTRQFDRFKLAANDWDAASTHPSTPAVMTASGAQAIAICRDPRNGDLYAWGNFTTHRLPYGAGAWTQQTGSAPVHGERMATAFDTRRQNILCLGGINATNPGHHTYDPDANTHTAITLTGAGAAAVATREDIGLVYIEDGDFFLAGIGSVGCPVYKITPTSPTSYSVVQLSTTGGGVIAAHDTDSAFSRFTYLPRIKCCAYFESYGATMKLLRVVA